MKSEQKLGFDYNPEPQHLMNLIIYRNCKFELNKVCGVHTDWLVPFASNGQNKPVCYWELPSDVSVELPGPMMQWLDNQGGSEGRGRRSKLPTGAIVGQLDATTQTCPL